MAGPKGKFTIIGLPQLESKLRELSALGAGGPMQAVIFTDLTDPPYPFFLEYGTSRMPAYPAARPAFDEKKDEALGQVAEVLGRLVDMGRRDRGMVRLALLAGALPISNRWKELARWRTGDYRRSITIEVEEVP